MKLLNISTFGRTRGTPKFVLAILVIMALLVLAVPMTVMANPIAIPQDSLEKMVSGHTFNKLASATLQYKITQITASPTPTMTDTTLALLHRVPMRAANSAIPAPFDGAAVTIAKMKMNAPCVHTAPIRGSSMKQLQPRISAI